MASNAAHQSDSNILHIVFTMFALISESFMNNLIFWFASSNCKEKKNWKNWHYMIVNYKHYYFGLRHSVALCFNKDRNKTKTKHRSE